MFVNNEIVKLYNTHPKEYYVALKDKCLWRIYNERTLMVWS